MCHGIPRLVVGTSFGYCGNISRPGGNECDLCPSIGGLVGGVYFVFVVGEMKGHSFDGGRIGES